MRRPAIFAVCAVVLFVITAAAVRKYVQGLVPAQQVTETVHHTPVLVAGMDLPVGATLTAENVKIVRWPADAVPAGAFSDPSQLDGWMTRSALVANEPLLPDKLADQNARGVLNLVIPPGMRAASVRVNEVSGISGFVSPGSKVDIIVVLASAGEEAVKGAFTLLEDLEVLAIAQTMDQRDTKPTLVNTVTLLVTPARRSVWPWRHPRGRCSSRSVTSKTAIPGIRRGSRSLSFLRGLRSPPKAVYLPRKSSSSGATNEESCASKALTGAK